MLTSKPCWEGAKQESLGELPSSLITNGIRDNGMDVHKLAAESVRAGDEGTAEALYLKHVCLDDVLPLLGSYGLVLRVKGPITLLRKLRSASGHGHV
jgi:hypothetical protein